MPRRTPLPLVAALLIGVLLLAGCGTPSDPVDADLPDSPDPPEPVDLFDDERLLEVEIHMNADDEAILRQEGRTIMDAIGGDCIDSPSESPYTWFVADVVSVDGERLAEVGIRKKGFIGSLSEERPSLKLKFDRYIDGQELQGHERFTLNNNRQDPAVLRTCFAYHVFELAGLPAPRCNFARVTLNGDDLGVYSHVEAVKKDFLRRAFGNADGDLYEGTLSDFREGWMGSFEAKTGDTDPNGLPLRALSDALLVSDAELEDALSAVIDLDEFIRFWAVESLVGHVDGYTSNNNNFFVYRSPTDDLLHFIPWGADAILMDGLAVAAPIYVTAVLPQRLYATDWGRAAYMAELQSLFDEIWDTEELIAQVDAWEELFIDAAHDPAAARSAIDDIRWTIDTRRRLFAGALSAGGYDLELEPRSVPCVDVVGSLELSFETSWGTLGVDDPFVAGTSEWSGELEGTPLPAMDAAGALAGLNEEGWAILASFGLYHGHGSLAQVFLVLPVERLRPGVVELDIVRQVGYFMQSTPPDAEPEFAGLVSGILELDQAGSEPGDPISGRLVADIVRGPE